MKLILPAMSFLLAGCTIIGGDKSVSSSEAAASAPNVKLYTFDCGRIDISDLDIFAQEDEYSGQQDSFVAPCYVIRHPKGDLVWDAGLPDALNEQEDGVTNGPFHLSVPVTFASQLEDSGITLEEIDYVTFSHSHFDHLGNASLLTGATFLVDEDEYHFMFRDEARADPQTFPLYAELEISDTTVFDGDYDVFGDGSVKILAMPGHTPGHTVLLVNLANAGPVLLSGDLYHRKESRERRLVPKFNVDVEQTLASMDRFEKIAAETGARVIVEHSVEDFESMPKAPDYLD